MTTIKDKAGEEYWSTVWKNTDLPPAFEWQKKSINNYPDRLLHQLFVRTFKDHKTHEMKLLEIGCGNSVLLPYLAKAFGFQVSRLDYSETGCEQSKRILEREKVKGNIVCADAFNPPVDLIESFDVVCSFGVIEHFNDTKGTLSAFGKFLKPGGILVTTLPNMTAATGYLHKTMNPTVYHIHVPLSAEDMVKNLNAAGFKPQIAEYFTALSFAITLEDTNGKKVPFYFAKKLFVKLLRYSSKIIWLIEDRTKPIKAGRIFSGGIFTSAIK